MCACATHHILLAGTQCHTQDVIGHRVSPCRCHVIRIRVDPDAHTPSLAVDVLIVCLFKDVQCPTTSRADEPLGVGGYAVHTDLLFLFTGCVHYSDAGTVSEEWGSVNIIISLSESIFVFCNVLWVCLDHPYLILWLTIPPPPPLCIGFYM